MLPRWECNGAISVHHNLRLLGFSNSQGDFNKYVQRIKVFPFANNSFKTTQQRVVTEEFPELLICYLTVNGQEGGLACGHFPYTCSWKLCSQSNKTSYLDPGFSLSRDDGKCNLFTCKSTSRNLPYMYAQRFIILTIYNKLHLYPFIFHRAVLKNET